MKTIRPLLTLRDIFGPSLICNPRASYQNHKWLSSGPGVLDFLSGAALTIAGEMPIICHSSVTTSPGLALLHYSHLHVAPNRYTYDNRSDYRRLLKEINRKKENIVLNYRHLPGEINDDKYWINPKLLSFLNNKANLTSLVPPRHIPKRMLISPSQLRDGSQTPFRLPFVIKAATDEPTGGGSDLVICKSKKDINRSAQFFKSCPFVIVEEFIRIKLNFCVQFAVTSKRKMIYLGSTEQVHDERGRYQGNWIDPQTSPPPSVIQLGKRIMKKAVALGYWGIAGFDIVVTEDNRILVIDLNFRLNGSTPALLLRDSIVRSLSKRVLRFRSWHTTSTFKVFSNLAKSKIQENQLVPLRIYHPQSGSSPDRPIRLSGILVGNSRDEIVEIEKELEKKGLR